MFQSLTNKVLAPHRQGTDAQGTEPTHPEGHHHHGLHLHKHHSGEHATQGVAPVVAPVAGAPLAAAPLVPVVGVAPVPASTSTHIVVDEGIIERETIVKEAIVDEKVRVDTIIEVQPVVHREIDQTIVNHVEQHVVEPAAAFVGGTVRNQAIVQENVVTNVTEEIQPVVHRELAVPVVERVEEHLQERIVEPTVHTNETLTREGLAANVTYEKGAIVKTAIIDEKVRTDTIVEIQPVIHRDVTRVVVNHVEKHIVEPEAAFVGGTVRNQAIIDEHINTRNIEEIQPVVHREVAVAQVQKVEEHLQEHVVAPTQHTHDVTRTAGRIGEITHNPNAVVKPVIVDETVRQDRVIEVQPIVHREVEKPVVHHIEQHIQEPAAAFVGGKYENKPIIEEHLKTKVIDEVQPVYHKERAVAQVEKREEHIQEHLVAPTIDNHDTRTITGLVSDISLGANAVLKPAIIDQKVRTDTIVEVQPIVHKEIQQNIVHHVEAHVLEPAAPNVGGTIRNQPIIDQREHTTVVNEVQPVVHREIAVPKLEKVEEHFAQSVTLPTTHTSTTTTETVGVVPLAAGAAPVAGAKPGILQKVADKVEEKMEQRAERKQGQAL